MSNGIVHLLTIYAGILAALVAVAVKWRSFVRRQTRDRRYRSEDVARRIGA